MTSVRFTETMSGYATLGATDPTTGDEQGRRDGTRLSFTLTITAEDVEAFLADPAHAATAKGHVECDALGGRLPVEQGWFNLFVADSPVTRQMRYLLWFRDAAGHPLTLGGVKHISDDRGMDAWADTTTLFTRIKIGHVDQDDETAQVTAAGVLHISIPAFARQLTTFRAAPGTPRARAAALTRFGTFFGGELWKVYGRRLRALAGAGI
jgi:cholesterol oxidase